MDELVITPQKIMDLAKEGWDAIIKIYKESTPEQRMAILKILGALGGFGALLAYLKDLK